MTKDPFTQTLEKLWQLLEEHEGFSALVRLGNRIKGGAAGKTASLPADLPEVRIEPAGGKVELFATSSSSRAVQEFSIIVSTGDKTAEAAMFPLKWQLLKALGDAGDNLGLSFVRKVRVTDLAEKAPPKAGWAAWLTVAVEMWLPTVELRS